MTMNRNARLLNVGCGGIFHAAWTNVDVVPADVSVQRVDANKPLPFPDGHFDAVYASHVLEHLDPGSAPGFATECGRVLRSSGVLRLVVPDLEELARSYLSRLERLAGGDPTAQVEYDWVVLELIDQMTRVRTEGAMAAYLRSPHLDPAALDWIVRERLGRDAVEPPSVRTPRDVLTLLRRGRAIAAQGVLSLVARLLLGRKGALAVSEGLFRQSGEVHRWMYDRHSLPRLLQAAGFVGVRVVDPDTSAIPGFSGYGLDRSGGEVRKPNSLYVEAIRP